MNIRRLNIIHSNRGRTSTLAPNIVILCYFLMLYAFSHSSVSYALFRYALYTVVTHVSYANFITRFIRRALRSYAVTQLRILYPTPGVGSRYATRSPFNTFQAVDTPMI